MRKHCPWAPARVGRSRHVGTTNARGEGETEIFTPRRGRALRSPFNQKGHKGLPRLQAVHPNPCHVDDRIVRHLGCTLSYFHVPFGFGILRRCMCPWEDLAASLFLPAQRSAATYDKPQKNKKCACVNRFFLFSSLNLKDLTLQLPGHSFSFFHECCPAIPNEGCVGVNTQGIDGNTKAIRTTEAARGSSRATDKP